jgi:hypothetical protein
VVCDFICYVTVVLHSDYGVSYKTFSFQNCLVATLYIHKFGVGGGIYYRFYIVRTKYSLVQESVVRVHSLAVLQWMRNIFPCIVNKCNKALTALLHLIPRCKNE